MEVVFVGLTPGVKRRGASRDGSAFLILLLLEAFSMYFEIGLVFIVNPMELHSLVDAEYGTVLG